MVSPWVIKGLLAGLRRMEMTFEPGSVRSWQVWDIVSSRAGTGYE